MKAIILQQRGGVENLKITEIPRPSINGEVLVRVAQSTRRKHKERNVVLLILQ